MDTPIYDFAHTYAQSDTLRLHMPGHKGVSFLGCEPFDLTEISGADNLHDPEEGGIIWKSEQNATALFGTAHTLFSAGGSSSCINAMLYLVKCNACAAGNATNNRILAGRNAHKVFVNACGLLDLEPHWLYPAAERTQGLCGCEITPSQLEQALCKAPACAVYITSPDYLGNVADIAGLSAVCQKHGIPLLVDNAHGAYLKFLPTSAHPIDLGATMCCDSAHKTLPVLTGGAYLHLAKTAPYTYTEAKHAIALFTSTSPSYLILQSLDLCNRYLAEEYPQALTACITNCTHLKEHLCAHGLAVCESEPLKLVLDCTAMGCETDFFATRLRLAHMEPEFVDVRYIVCMFTPQITTAQYAMLTECLCASFDMLLQQKANESTCAFPASPVSEEVLPNAKSAQKKPPIAVPFPAPHEAVCSIRQAMFSRSEIIPTHTAFGRICHTASVSCPPAIPIVISGERITQEDIALFAYYGIETVSVIL